MVITTKERRAVLGLLNVSEMARQLEIPIQRMHYGIRAGVVARPEVRLGKRWYYRESDLTDLAKHYAKKESHP